jgi:hypothetical protein
VTKREETNRNGLTRNNEEKCENCGEAAKVLAQFNGKQVCTVCFEQMIRIRIGLRGKTSVAKEIAEIQLDNSQGDMMLAV